MNRDNNPIKTNSYNNIVSDPIYGDNDKPLILLASGTGFAPIKAIIEHAIHKGIKRPMTLGDL